MKLVIAALPIVLALAGLSALTVRDGLADVRRAGSAADLSATWEPLVAAVSAIDAERDADTERTIELRRSTNRAMVETEQALLLVGDDLPALEPHARALTAIGAARTSLDEGAPAEAQAAYDAARAELVAVGRLLPVEAGSAEQGRALGAVAGLVEVEQTALVVLGRVDALSLGQVDATGPERLAAELDRAAAALALLRATADDELRADVRATGLASALDATRQTGADLQERLTAGDTTATFDPETAETLASAVTRVGTLRDDLVAEVVASSRDDARTIVLQTWARVIATVLAIGAAIALAVVVSRSITRRLREVSTAAQQVTDERLPVLVEALRDPRGRTALPAVEAIDDHGTDELSELARSFNRMQTTLGEVAREQLEVLERGVSDIFVTMARRNRSLVDRQLSLLDDLEAKEEDPSTLAHYYRLDHLATRMRRNSESLLVLADSDSRTRIKGSASVDDIVRAAISEVEDYQRIEILSLEHLKIRGVAVADLTHLLAELLENATAFSPPTSRVRVTGDLIDGRYRILVMDEGMGVPDVRLGELNDLLAHPPVLGLSVEPTLGMSVVSLLAGAHGVAVELLPGSPGTIARIVLPTSSFERRLTDRPEADLPAVSVRPALEPMFTPPAVETVRVAPPAEAPDEIVDVRPTRETRSATRQARRSRSDQAEKAGKSEKAEKAEKSEKAEKAEKAPKGGRRDKRNKKADRRAAAAAAPVVDEQVDEVSDEPAAPLALRLSDLVTERSPSEGPAIDESPSTELAALARGREDDDRRDAPRHDPDDLGFDFGRSDRRGGQPEHDDDPFWDDRRAIDPGLGSGLGTASDPLPRRQRQSTPDEDWGHDRLESRDDGQRPQRDDNRHDDLGDLDITPSWARREQEQRPPIEPFTAAPPSARPTPNGSPMAAPPPMASPPPPPPTHGAPGVPPPPVAAPLPSPGAAPPPAFGPPGSIPTAASPPPPPPPQPVAGDLPTRPTGTVPVTRDVDDERSVTGVGAPSDLKAALVAFELGRRSATDHSTPARHDGARYDEPRFDDARFDDARFDDARFDDARFDDARFDDGGRR